EDPYRLAREIRGIGFRSADTIAAKLGIERTAAIRVRAGIRYALAEAMDEGHCGLPRPLLLELAARLIEVAQDLIERELAGEIEAGHVVTDTLDRAPSVFLASLYHAEREIAARLAALAHGPVPWPAIDPEKALPWVEGKTGLALSVSQRAASAMALVESLLVITGGPGVGKTTLVNVILAVLRAKGVRIALAAPTGRGAKRLAESTGLPAKTIHRLLEINPATGRFRRDETMPLACDLLVLDEASMVDVPLMRSLLRALPEGAALLIIGDVDQIPSVGPGQVLRDVIASGVVPVVRLTEIFRQAKESGIVRAAHRINQGLMPTEDTAGEPGDFHFVTASTPEELVAKLILIVRERIPAKFGLDPIRDVQVLCPMNRGALGARSLNVVLQKSLNPPDATSIERFGSMYGPGDKVM
ncbi:MAG: AAA family ATPase, partial [Acetobacteraceae bacterium]